MLVVKHIIIIKNTKYMLKIMCFGGLDVRQVFDRFSAGFRQVFVRFSAGFRQVFGMFSACFGPFACIIVGVYVLRRVHARIMVSARASPPSLFLSKSDGFDPHADFRQVFVRFLVCF